MRQRTRPPEPGWLVLIGIDNYTDDVTHPPLRCCVRDAIGLYILLTHPEHGNYAPAHVCLLLDGTDAMVRAAAQAVVQRLKQDYGVTTPPDLVDTIVRQRVFPEREAILAEIHRAAHNAGPEDLMLVHFAGHGAVHDGQTYLIPPRARHPLYHWTAIALSQVTTMLRQSRAQHALMLLDACYTGAALGQSTALTNDEVRAIVQAETNRVAVLASCLPWEQSLEQDDTLGRPGHSLFTLGLLEGLHGRADTARHGYVALGDLHGYVENYVKTWVAEHLRHGPLQTPTLNAAGEQHARCLVLSGDRHRALACRLEKHDVVAEADAPLADTTPLEVRVWAQPAGHRMTPRLRQGHTLPTFQIGQLLCLGLQTNHDAEVLLLNVDTAGRVTQLVPSGLWPQNRVRGGQACVIPTEQDEVDIPVEGVPGSVETLIAIAMRRPASPSVSPPRAMDVLPLPPAILSDNDLTRLAQELSRLPQGQWVGGGTVSV